MVRAFAYTSHHFLGNTDEIIRHCSQIHVARGSDDHLDHWKQPKVGCKGCYFDFWTFDFLSYSYYLICFWSFNFYFIWKWLLISSPFSWFFLSTWKWIVICSQPSIFYKQSCIRWEIPYVEYSLIFSCEYKFFTILLQLLFLGSIGWFYKSIVYVVQYSSLDIVSRR